MTLQQIQHASQHDVYFVHVQEPGCGEVHDQVEMLIMGECIKLQAIESNAGRSLITMSEIGRASDVEACLYGY